MNERQNSLQYHDVEGMTHYMTAVWASVNLSPLVRSHSPPKYQREHRRRPHHRSFFNAAQATQDSAKIHLAGFRRWRSTHHLGAPQRRHSSQGLVVSLGVT